MASACRSRLSISDGDTVRPSTGTASGIPNGASAKSASRTVSSAGGQPGSAAVPGSESNAARSGASAASASLSALPATVRSLAAASMRSVRSLKLASFGSPLAEPVGLASALAGRSAARRQSAASDARPCVISRRNRASSGCRRDRLTLPALAAVKSNSVVVAGSGGALAGAMTVARSSGTAFAHGSGGPAYARVRSTGRRAFRRSSGRHRSAQGRGQRTTEPPAPHCRSGPSIARPPARADAG